MLLPVDTWLPILEYRGFHDFPRLLLAGQEVHGYWVFDCSFDEGIDDYADSFEVWFAGSDRALAEHCLSLHSAGWQGPSGLVVPTVQVDFDPGRRACLRVSPMFRGGGS